MSGLRSLRHRLLAAQLALVALVVGAGLLTVRLLTPIFFDHGLGNGGHADNGRGGRGLQVSAEIQDTYDAALNNAVFVAALVGLVAAIGLATFLSRVLLRRLNELEAATHRLAAGNYRELVEPPPEAELAELARSINTLGATLAANEESRARLMSDVAHEIRNPLTTIEGYMEGLIDGVLPASEETYLEVAHEAGRLQRIAEDLSFMSRAGEGAVRYDLATLDLADTAQHTATRLRPQASAAGLTLTTALDLPLAVVADSGRVTQALTNVINNAIAHTPSGGTIAVTGGRSDSTCEITITDSGSGIAPEHLELIFERFTRFRDGAGIGIGLNIARSIATGLGGHLVATSEGLGKGSTFTFSLPAS